MEKLSAIEILSLARKRSVVSGDSRKIVLTVEEFTAISAELLGVKVDEPETVETNRSNVQLPGDESPGFFHEEEAETSG